MTKIAHRRTAVDNLTIFYRETGRSNTIGHAGTNEVQLHLR